MYEQLIVDIILLGGRIINTDSIRTDIDLFNLSSDEVGEFINYNNFKRQGLAPLGKTRYTNGGNVEVHLDWTGGFMTIVNFE
jgi:hypothetical protein